jgi:hypothetical protein
VRGGSRRAGSSDAGRTGLIVVWRHFGACKVSGASVSHDAVRIEVPVKVVASGPVAAPAE